MWQPRDDLEIECHTNLRDLSWQPTEQPIVEPDAKPKAPSRHVEGNAWYEREVKRLGRHHPRTPRSGFKNTTIPWSDIAIEIFDGIQCQLLSISLHHGQDDTLPRSHGLSNQTIGQHLVIKGHVAQHHVGVLVAGEPGNAVPDQAASRQAFPRWQAPSQGEDRAAELALPRLDRRCCAFFPTRFIHGQAHSPSVTGSWLP
jgi:hypothetical protein